MSASRRSNAELLQQLEERNPLLGLGCSYSPYPVRLWIQDMKNYYVDFYRYASKHVHFIHFKARARLANELVAKVESDLRDQVLKANEAIDEAIAQAEAMMKAHGITLSVTDTPNCSPPLCHTAEIISPLTNRSLQPIEKTDYLLRALDTLFQQEVISMQEYNLRRGLFKRQVKRFYYACRRFDEGLRGQMDAHEGASVGRPASRKSKLAAQPTGNGVAQARPVAAEAEAKATDRPEARSSATPGHDAANEERASNGALGAVDTARCHALDGRGHSRAQHVAS